MSTWDELIGRDPPCRKCRATFRVPGRLDEQDLAQVRKLLERGQGISAIRLIREGTPANLRDAKGIYEHVTIFRNTCRQCRTALDGSLLSDCAACDALNINA
jgi:hypothetical protein